MSFEISKVLQKHPLIFAFTEQINIIAIMKPVLGKNRGTVITFAISLPDAGLIFIKQQRSPLTWNFIFHQKNWVFKNIQCLSGMLPLKFCLCRMLKKINLNVLFFEYETGKENRKRSNELHCLNSFSRDRQDISQNIPVKNLWQIRILI